MKRAFNLVHWRGRPGGVLRAHMGHTKTARKPLRKNWPLERQAGAPAKLPLASTTARKLACRWNGKNTRLPAKRPPSEFVNN